jgi:hypothetical protein
MRRKTGKNQSPAQILASPVSAHTSPVWQRRGTIESKAWGHSWASMTNHDAMSAIGGGSPTPRSVEREPLRWWPIIAPPGPSRSASTCRRISGSWASGRLRARQAVNVKGNIFRHIRGPPRAGSTSMSGNWSWPTPIRPLGCVHGGLARGQHQPALVVSDPKRRTDRHSGRLPFASRRRAPHPRAPDGGRGPGAGRGRQGDPARVPSGAPCWQAQGILGP